MEFDNLDGLQKIGIKGFKKVEVLQDNTCADVPRVQGIYIVFRSSKTPPKFLSKSIGGHFKKKDPSVSILELQANWVENAKVLYIGKAGGRDSNATLKSRLWQYMQFATGKPIGHWGGRYIWQLEGSNELLVGWRAFDVEEPKDVESNMIAEFVNKYGKRPFANLKD